MFILILSCVIGVPVVDGVVYFLLLMKFTFFSCILLLCVFLMCLQLEPDLHINEGCLSLS